MLSRMGVSSTRCIQNVASSYSCAPYRTNLQSKFSLPLKPNTITLNNPGLRYYSYSPIKATSSNETSNEANQYVKQEPEVVNYSPVEPTTPDEASNGVNQYVKEEPDAVNYSSTEVEKSEEESNGVNQYAKEETDDVVTVNESQPVESGGFGGFDLFKDKAAADDRFPQYDFLNKLKVELDLEDSLSIALLGVGGITALWLTTSILGAIDYIPLLPKLLELVGLGYTIWFCTRYLLFKSNRDELALKIEEIKQQVLGPKN
ncbi:uncharacterized protein LOC143584806 [Bidens hawaiensis]|uniref:uncharacterized protein LOC143584806 n=1 Tax=Bidens hawaiensis TaxID=980011 RepID=UPI0040492F1C